jgi:HK97 family phage prohead protease
MPEENLIRKTYATKAEIDDEERTVTAVISTSAVDREREVLLPKGADFEQYLKNPVVLWAHDYRDTPIGKAVWIKTHPKTTPKEIRAQVKFAETEKAEEVYQLFKGKFLNAFSVGFLPAENGSHPPTPEEVKKHPEWAEASRIYDNWELLEFSAVPVPANPEALATAVKSKGIKLSEKTITELGIDETTYYEDTEVADAVEKSIEEEAKTEPPKILVPMKETAKLRRPIKIRPHIDTAEQAQIVIKKLKGRMY